MNAKKVTIAAFGSLLLIGGVAYAASEGFGPGGMNGPMGGHMGGPKAAMRADAAFVRMLKLADADKDGKITKAEADAGFTKVFDAIDTDKDNAATPGEFRTYMKARMEEFSKNNPGQGKGQGQGMGQGMGQGPGKGAEQAMQDGMPGPDGKGPGAMMGKHQNGEHGMGGKHRDGEHGKGGDGHRWFGQNGDGKERPMKASFMIRQADTDQNGQVSRDEAQKFGEGIFVRMDTNKDGVISIDDLPDRPFP